MKQPFFHAYSTITDGNMSFLYGEKSEVIENRTEFLKKHSLDLNCCVALRTHHGTEIEIVDSTFQGKGIEDIDSAIRADAILTQDKNVVLFLLTADCLPIIFYDSKHQAIGLAHLSRENTGVKFVEKIIDTFRERFKTDPQSMLISIGPGIHRESYASDLIGENVEQCIGKGIRKDNISVSSINTFVSSEYFSHRRSEVKREQEGRFATIAKL